MGGIQMFECADSVDEDPIDVRIRYDDVRGFAGEPVVEGTMVFPDDTFPLDISRSSKNFHERLSRASLKNF
jgi:hypothetical protein